MGLQTTYNPDKDIPDLAGKVIFITGAGGTAGLGKQTIATLAQHNPEHILFTGRNAQAAESVINETKATTPSVKLTFIPCDHASLTSVQNAAQQLLQQTTRLDILIANAGIMGGDPGVSVDGYEIQFAVNYLSHALFIKLLLPLLERTAAQEKNARIVLLSSVGFMFTPAGGIVFKDLKSPQTNLPISYMQAKWFRYGQSKLALVLLAQDLAERYTKITTVAVHPGAINTGLIEDKPVLERLFLKFVTWGKTVGLEQGVWNTCWAATAPVGDQIKSGGLYEPVGVLMKGTRDSENRELRGELRRWTEGELRSFGDGGPDMNAGTGT